MKGDSLAIAEKPMDDAGNDVCAKHIQDHVGDNTHFICLAAAECPDDLIDLWREYIGTYVLPESATIILLTPVDMETPSQLTTDERVPITIRAVKPDDLTGVSIALGETLRQHPGEELLVCMRGLGILSIYVETGRVYRLLQTCLNILRDNEATVHAHLPEGEISNRFSELFETTTSTEEYTERLS